MTLPPNRVEDEEEGAPARAPGDMRALMDRYGPALKRYFRRRAGSGEADDLTQEVFLSLHLRRTAAPIENLEGYLFRIAAAVLSKRHSGRPARMALADAAAAREAERIEEVSPERVLIARETLSRLIVALQSLPPRARTAFVLHRFEENTYAAIAARMGISVSAVEQLISRAARRLTAAMEDRAEDVSGGSP